MDPLHAGRLELADSELAGGAPDAAGTLVLRFSAASVQQGGGAKGQPAAAGYARGVSLRLWTSTASAAAPGAPAGWLGRIRSGRVLLGGRWRPVLPLPSGRVAAERIELALADGTAIDLPITALETVLAGDAAFPESFAC